MLQNHVLRSLQYQTYNSHKDKHRVIAQCARLAFGVSVPENNKIRKLVNSDTEIIKIHKDCKKMLSHIENLKINLKGKLG